MKQLLLLILTVFTGFIYAQKSSTNEEICLNPDVEATYPAGKIALYDYLMTHYEVTPSMKIINDDEAIVRLVGEKDGSFKMEGFKKMNKECAPCNDELVRVIKTIERFTPGMKEDKPMRSYLDVHVTLFDFLEPQKSSPFANPPAPPSPSIQSKQDIATFVDEEAQFPGGQSELMRYLSQKIKYPERALKEKIQGKIAVQFVVEKTGELTNIQIIKRMPECPECEQEAIRILKQMPKWIPAKLEGQSVRSKYTLPVSFKL